MQSTEHKAAQRSSSEFCVCESNQHFLFSSCDAFIVSCSQTVVEMQTHHIQLFIENGFWHVQKTWSTEQQAESELFGIDTFRLAGIPSCSQSKQANHSSPEQLYITHKSCAASHKALALLQPQSPQSYSQTHGCASLVTGGFVYEDFPLLLCEERNVWERGDGRLYLSRFCWLITLSGS